MGASAALRSGSCTSASPDGASRAHGASRSPAPPSSGIASGSVRHQPPRRLPPCVGAVGLCVCQSGSAHRPTRTNCSHPTRTHRHLVCRPQPHGLLLRHERDSQQHVQSLRHSRGWGLRTLPARPGSPWAAPARSPGEEPWLSGARAPECPHAEPAPVPHPRRPLGAEAPQPACGALPQALGAARRP